MFIRDVRYALRLLIRNPAFAGAAVAVMALGIGATTAVFSVVRGVLLEPLPYREPHRLVVFRVDAPGYTHQAALIGNELEALRARPDLFESIAVANASEGNLTSPDDMEAVTAASISDNFLETLGVRPLLGRSVARGDVDGKEWVEGVDISFELWQRHFHGDATIVGRRIEVNNLPMTVVGVLPPRFKVYLGPGVTIAQSVDVFYPRAADYDRATSRGMVVVARLRGGVTVGAAHAALPGLMSRVMAEHPASYRLGAARLSLATLDQDVVSEVKPALVAVAGAVAFVLLIACANLTNLLLARASARSREIALRLSIGASRGQIVRQLLAEGLVVGALGAMVGLLLAQWCVDALLLLAPAALPRREAIAVNGTVAAFAIVVSLLSALLVSLMPAWQAARSDVVARLKQDPASSRGAGTTRGLLVAGQLALSLVLLVGAGLMARAFVSMRRVSLGFDPRNTIAINVRLSVRQFGVGDPDEARERRLTFYQQLADAVRQMRGVERAGLGLPLPLRGTPMNQSFSIGPGEQERQADGIVALAGYLETMRVAIVAGRAFTAADDDRAVVIVERRLADDLWPQESAIGRRLLIGPSATHPRWAEVVGVAAHVQMASLRAPGLPQLWMTYATRSYSGLNLVVRAQDPRSLVPAIEASVQRLGAGRPVHDIRLLDEVVADASADTRFALFVLGAIAVLAVVLTAIGVYGVVAYTTARRTREIALRLALGADRRAIVALVLREGLAWTAAGLAAGGLAARALTRYLESLLFNVTAADAATFIAVGATLGTIALVATALPVIRAVRVDPMLALRSE